jgi:hypothetical protein
MRSETVSTSSAPRGVERRSLPRASTVARCSRGAFGRPSRCRGAHPPVSLLGQRELAVCIVGHERAHLVALASASDEHSCERSQLHGSLDPQPRCVGFSARIGPTRLSGGQSGTTSIADPTRNLREIRLVAESLSAGQRWTLVDAAWTSEPAAAARVTTKASAKQEKTRSPLTDSNRRPLFTILTQPVATHGNGFRLISRFRGHRICHRLPPVATARLHKRSIARPI